MTKNKDNTFLLSTLIQLVAFAMLFGLALILAERQHQSDLELDLEAGLSQFARDSVETLRSAVDDLRAVATVMVNFEDVTLAQFQNLAQASMGQRGELLILEWQPVVPGGEREQFVSQVRVQPDLADFSLWQPDTQGNPMPAEPRDEHVPVLYMYSRHTSANTLGLDLAWSVERMASKWQARDEGVPRSSGFFKVVTGKKGEYSPVGFAITLPVYEDGVVPSVPAQRQEKLVGYIAGVYSAADLMAPHLQRLAANSFNLMVSDSSDSGVALQQITGEDAGLSRTTWLNLMGNDWIVQLNDTRERQARHRSLMVYLLPLTVMLVAFMIFFYQFRLQRSRRELASANQQVSTALEQARLSEEKLKTLSREDPLTGLLNRRAFDETLNLELERAERQNVPLSLMLLDLDHFKQVNDKWGHPVGDQLLKHFANICQKLTRRIDTLARIGGEEFVILLPGTDLEAAEHYAERLRKTVEQTPLTVEGQVIELTTSIGLAPFEAGVNNSEMLLRADKALYMAKHNGRNCTRSYQQAGSSDSLT